MFLMPPKLPEYQWLLSYKVLSDCLENSKPHMLGSLKKYWTMPDPYFPYLSRLPKCIQCAGIWELGNIVCHANNNGGDAVHMLPFEFFFTYIFHTPFRRFRRCARWAGAYITYFGPGVPGDRSDTVCIYILHAWFCLHKPFYSNFWHNYSTWHGTKVSGTPG